MTEPFDTVLADVDKFCEWPYMGHTGVTLLREWRSRLSAAHSAEVAERDARIAELEVAIGQAVEFAQYVEDAAKGAMVERAKHYLSQPYAQELAARLARAEAAERDARRLRELLRQASDYVRIAADEEANLNTHKIPEAHRTTEARFFAEINAAIATTEQADE